VTEYEHYDNEDAMVNGGVTTDLTNGEEAEFHDDIEERQTQQEKSQRLQDQLKALTSELTVSRDDTKETRMDQLHKENVKQGRDKYKTLREVRKGNTKRRVDQFENL